MVLYNQGKGKRTETKKKFPRWKHKLVDVPNELSERILRVKTIGLLICRYFSSEEGEIPWQATVHMLSGSHPDPVAVRIGY